MIRDGCEYCFPTGARRANNPVPSPNSPSTRIALLPGGDQPAPAAPATRTMLKAVARPSRRIELPAAAAAKPRTLKLEAVHARVVISCEGPPTPLCILIGTLVEIYRKQKIG